MSTLVNACASLAQLRTSVAHKRMRFEKEKLELKLNRVLESQVKPLEDWAAMERQHALALSKTNQYLEALACRVPLIEGAKGCDGSLLLDDTSTFTGENNAVPNRNSARGFNVIDDIKSEVERGGPGVVSCADIIAIASRDSVVILGGPSWDVKLGRRDARTASQAAANNSIPPPTSSLRNLTISFQAQGLSIKELVALAGSHTIGQARCTSFRNHIYNETNIDTSFARMRQGNCPSTSGSGDMGASMMTNTVLSDPLVWESTVMLQIW